MKSKLQMMKLMLRKVAMIASIGILSVSISSCDEDSNDPDAAIRLISSPSLGSYLTDRDGNALYFFSNDVSGENTCTGNCATVWPIFYEDALTADMLADGLDIDDFATITSASGQQTTYKGWPLYYYAPAGVRESPNQTTGEAVGGIWFVAKTEYTIMVANAQLFGQDGKNYKGDYTEGTEKVQYFTDQHGRTLYSFMIDKKNDNNFTNGDGAHDAIWPIYGETLSSVPSTLDKALFGTINVSGSTQLTYKGWPIYYFGNDAKRGDNKGVSVPTPGVWPVVIKDAEDAPE